MAQQRIEQPPSDLIEVYNVIDELRVAEKHPHRNSIFASVCTHTKEKIASYESEPDAPEPDAPEPDVPVGNIEPDNRGEPKRTDTLGRQLSDLFKVKVMHLRQAFQALEEPSGYEKLANARIQLALFLSQNIDVSVHDGRMVIRLLSEISFELPTAENNLAPNN